MPHASKELQTKLSGEGNTDLFVVKLDGAGCIIYEPIKKETF